jgi:DNA-binding NtrC family response regulator
MAPGAKTLDEETVQRTMGKPTGTRPEAAQITAVHPPGLRRSMRLGDGEVVLGRRPKSDEAGLRLEDKTASRRHFAIRWDGERHVGVDLGSRNGSRVDGVDVRGATPAPLSDGSVVRLGDVLLVYERGPFVGSEDHDAVDRDAVFGSAARVVQLRRQLGAAAPDPSAVLLVGETGTGKEYVAREIHRLSGRTGPFVAVNCAALSPQLVESQLFGHKKGAFTGAQASHEGLFRAAEGGTIFLDEVGELPTEMQPKLLRVLQEKEVHPVGETRPVKIDVRVVSATLRDLTSMVDDKAFRLDLYARLSPWELRVPALRDRRVDILPWLDRLAAAWHRERDRKPVEKTLEANAAERILLHPWPDNLRGLDRLVHRAYSEIGAPLDVEIVDAEPAPPPPADEAAEPAEVKRPKPDKAELARILDDNGGSVRATAKYFGRDRRQIYRWMDQYGLRDKE